MLTYFTYLIITGTISYNVLTLSVLLKAFWLLTLAPGVPELAVLGGKLSVLGGALPVLSVWVFESLFVEVTEFLVNVSRCKIVWGRLLYPEIFHECFDRRWHIIWSDERQLKHSLRSSTGVAFNTIQPEILWLSLQNRHLNLLSSTWGLPDYGW